MVRLGFFAPLDQYKTGKRGKPLTKINETTRIKTMIRLRIGHLFGVWVQTLGRCLSRTTGMALACSRNRQKIIAERV